MNAELKTLIVKAGVRYWEDATVNGAEDINGTLIPLRVRDEWCPTIELDTGKIRNWPQGTIAYIHYKVCDAGQYWLGDDAGNKLLKWQGDYVPDRFLCVGDRGFGDYIILTVSNDGVITGWKKPHIDTEEEWKTEGKK